MKTLFRNTCSRIFALLAAFALVFAQGGAQAQTAYSFSQQELDQMLAPIALYPDALLAQVLMAATYPMEVVEAARWARARPDLSGDAAVRAAETENWDPSVKSLLAFPQVLARMGENLQWLQALGDAFLEQPSQVMDTVQALRRRAQAEGNMRSDDRVSIVESGPNLLVQPFDPEIVYVPYYDPLVVYGSWWWPAYPPMYLRPWPGYYARPAYTGGFYWGPPIGIAARFFFGTIDWRQRQVRVVQVNNYYYNPTTVHQANASLQASVNRPSAWHHDPEHRRGLSYRSADVQHRFGAASTRSADARRSDAGRDTHPDARFEPRPHAPAAPAAPIETRIAGRRPEVHTGAPPVRDTVLARPANTTRYESPRETRPAGTAAEARWGRASSLAARPEPSARFDVPRAPQPRMESRPAPSAPRRENAPMAAARHEPSARHLAPQASAPRAEMRPAQAPARQEPGARFAGRPRTGP